MRKSSNAIMKRLSTYGNLTADLNRGVESIAYNELNLPAAIRCGDGTVVRNWYAADGRLLKREVRPKTARLTREVFIGGFIFNQNALNRLILKQTGTPTGYLDKDGGVHSFVKDYQGNVRQVMSESGAVEQESHYYPYGMLMGESDVNGSRATANRYRYGGKEYLPSSGLNLYDFSARYLDPAGCGFLSSDPMQGDYIPLSPTSYCGADPINFIDPSGCDLTFTGEAAQEAFRYLQDILSGRLNLSMDESGKVSYEFVKQNYLPDYIVYWFMLMMDDHSIELNIVDENSIINSIGGPLVGGAFMGNTIIKNENESTKVKARQEINTRALDIIGGIFNYNEAPFIHELTEAYTGAKISLNSNTPAILGTEEYSRIYLKAHKLAYPSATPDIYIDFLDKNNNILSKSDTSSAILFYYYVWKNGQKIVLQNYFSK